MIYLFAASLTLRNFPLNGKTPYLSLPITSIPARAKLFAESPSVKIIVQSFESLVPAEFASSSFGIINLEVFFPGPIVLASFAYSLASATFRIVSTTPLSKMPFRNLSESSIVLPKSFAGVFKVSFV